MKNGQIFTTRCPLRQQLASGHTDPVTGNGEDIKVVQELLRHANSRITLDTYTQAKTPAKRAAQSKVVEMLVRKPTEAEENSAGYWGTATAVAEPVNS